MKKSQWRRRLSVLTAAALLAGTVLPVSAAPAATGSDLSWDQADEILTHISDPVFPDYQEDITANGAVAGDGKLDTAAIQQTIDEVSEKGGGTVIVPSGVFDTGAITLKNNVNLCLENPDSVLAFTKDINTDNYPIVFAHFEGSGCYNYSPFIYANGQANIAVTGQGVLDGQADENTWWNWKTEKLAKTSVIRKMTDNAVPFRDRVLGDGYYLRPNFFQPIDCVNVKIEGVTIKNSPMWEINPVLCTNVTVRKVTIDSHGYNNDGCDPENCNYVLIEGCYFNTGDDCIAIKAGRNLDGRLLGYLGYSTQNIIIRNNVFADGHGGITCGSEMSGDIRNVFADNNVFTSENLNYAIRFKTNAERGGVVENVYIRNSTIDKVGNAAIHATMLYDVGRDGDYLPQFRNITIENLTAHGGEYGIFMEAFDEVLITGLVLRNINIDGAEKEVRAYNWQNPVMDNVVINGKTYPRPVDTKITGVPAAGNTLSASSTLLGSDSSSLTYSWLLSDTKDAAGTKISNKAELPVTNDMIGKYLTLTATDPDGNTDSSIAYKVLDDTQVVAAAGDEILTRAESKGYIDDITALDPTQEVTNRDVAKMLGRLWGLTAPEEAVAIDDVPADDPDYGVIAAVVEKGMMNLKDPAEDGATGTLYNTSISRDAEAKRTAFLPDEKVTREELGYIFILACGVPYNETLGTNAHFDDADQIDDAYADNVGASEYFGFVKAKSGNTFAPKDNATLYDLIYGVEQISDFANR